MIQAQELRIGNLLTKLILAAILVLAGCGRTEKLEKPFVIIGKNVTYSQSFGHYVFQDKNGNTSNFSDTKEAYKIGDTIK